MQTQNQTHILAPIAAALADGVEYLNLTPGTAPPAELQKCAIVHFDDSGVDGPAAFSAESILPRCDRIVIVESPIALPAAMIGALSRRGTVALITCGATFRFWFQLITRLGLQDRTAAVGLRDPNARLDS